MVVKRKPMGKERNNTYQLRICDFIGDCSCHSNNLVPEGLEKIDNKNCLIQVSTETRKQLQEIGIMGSSYESVIQKLLRHVNSCQEWWEEKN